MNYSGGTWWLGPREGQMWGKVVGYVEGTANMIRQQTGTGV